ncbi:unnamed protein product [Phytomonas sp. Hart1]|nr:unnamed protein product [Phytomonas sp. Hart1]|eukprot:CCW68273.1 unnamed protein product [Phytomonas sp. isolate Hart1]
MNRTVRVSEMQELLRHYAQEINALENKNDLHCIKDTHDNHDFRELMELIQSQSYRTDSLHNPPHRSLRLTTRLSGDRASAADDWDRSKDEALQAITANLLVAHSTHKAQAGVSHADGVSESMAESLRVLAEGGISGDAFRNLRLRLLEQMLLTQREKIPP